jgi:hypothetical protein
MDFLNPPLFAAAALEDYRWELARYRLDLFFGWGTPHWPGWAWYPPFPPPPRHARPRWRG